MQQTCVTFFFIPYPRYFQCRFCRVTYYCEKEHEALDYRGIHQKICQLLIPVRYPFFPSSHSNRAPLTILGSENERVKRDAEMRASHVFEAFHLS